jgi:CHAD domain-containing protein
VISPANGGRGSPPKQKPKRAGKPVKIRWDASRTVTENASEKLPELARGFYAAGRNVAADGSVDALHRFRLLTKRFRYTLELFRPCYGPGMARRIEALRALQQYLGEINDCATTRELLAERDDLRPAERRRLVRHLRELSAARIAKFRSHWQEEFAEPARERWWTDYLTRFAAPRQR